MKQGATKMKQHEQILTHLRKAGGLSVREALVDYSIQSFTKRISELRKLGYDIIGIPSSHPVTGQRYTRYVLTSA